MRVDASGSLQAHQLPSTNQSKQYGIFVGKVKDVADPDGHGKLRVWIPQLSNTKEDDPSSWFTLRYAAPFGGTADPRREATARDATAVQQTNLSYGMWMVPPTINVHVVCGFLNGDTQTGIWWAVLPHDGHTHALPAVSSGSTHDGKIRPVAERNRYNTADAQRENRPEHPASLALSEQGLENDLRRGQSNAGPFRNKNQHPGLVYGLLSPGQHSFMLDDGPDGVSGGIRLRTSKGHQILMHDEGEFIYIVNANGTAWIELDEHGNIDFYANKDFSVHAAKNINFHAGDNINFQAGNDVNGSAKNNIKIEACEVMHLTGVNGQRLTSRLTTDILADGGMKLTAQRIDLNGPPAAAAELPGQNSLVTNQAVGRSVASRVPEREPWGGHSRLAGGEQITVPTGTPSDLRLGQSNIIPAEDSYTVPPESADALNCIPKNQLDNTVMSESAFNMMKSREGYRGMMYSDFQGYSVGYGTRVDIFGPGNPNSRLDRNLQEALVRGPSEPEARQASRQVIDRHVTPGVRNRLRQQMDDSTCITQAQFDALCMAAYGNPSQANNMTDQLVAAAKQSPDGRASNADVARIWANAGYVNDANQRNQEAQFALTGQPPPGVRVKTADELAREGMEADRRAVLNNRARNPAYGEWRGEYGNGPQSGARVQAAYGRPTNTQQEQWERSYYLNTGQTAPNSRLSQDQLAARYGAPQVAGNSPPGGLPVAVAGGRTRLV